MKNNLKKMWPIATASFSILTTGVNAESAQIRNLESRVNALEQRRGSSGMINPPARPQVKNGTDLFLSGDLLVWNAHENGLFPAIVNHGSSSNLAHAKVKNIHSNWDIGFRIGLGYNLPHDGWDTKLVWTHFNTHGSKRIHTNGVIFPSLVHPNDPIATDAACKKDHSHFRLHLNQLDLDLGREFFISKWLTLRPHFGLRTDWIEQKYDSTFRQFNSLPTQNKVKVDYHDHWWGMGIAAGLDTQWGLGCGWSLFGNMTGAILYGFHDIDVKENGFTPKKETYVDLDNTYRISHPILDMMLGLRYDAMLDDDHFHLRIQLGWEHHIYFSQNQFPIFTDNTALGSFVSNQGDLAFQGWTISARFDF